MDKSEKYRKQILKEIEYFYNAFNSFNEKFPSESENDLIKSCESFRTYQAQVMKEFEQTMFKFLEQPFITAFLVWTVNMKTFDVEIPDLAMMLLKENLAPIFD